MLLEITLDAWRCKCRGEKQPQGMLYVSVIKAKDLKNKDFLGKSDPYVKLTVGNSTQKTRTIMNNLNPEWNETFSLVVDDPETESLDISVYDWDKVHSLHFSHPYFLLKTLHAVANEYTPSRKCFRPS